MDKVVLEKNVRILILCPVVMLLFACGSGEPASESDAASEQLLKGQQQALESAKETAKALEQAAQTEAEGIDKMQSD